LPALADPWRKSGGPRPRPLEAPCLTGRLCLPGAHKNHSPISTTINLDTCTTGSGGFYSLTNNNGTLVCDQHGSSSALPVATAVKVPTGSYGITCMNCSLDASHLQLLLRERK